MGGRGLLIPNVHACHNMISLIFCHSTCSHQNLNGIGEENEIPLDTPEVSIALAKWAKYIALD